MGIMRSFFRRHRSRSKSRRDSDGDHPEDSPTSPAGQQLSRTPLEELERVFEKFDSNGDGKISSVELGAIFHSLGHPPTEEELGHMMAEADADGDGFISLAEFVELNTRDVDPTDAIEDLRHAFSVFDLDRNGSISAEELARVLRGLGEGATVAQCRRMIEGVDRDGDGMISFEEFKVMMTGSSLGAVMPSMKKIDG